ncbi:guanylate-binding family protein [Medicago truncatula]|uniref:Guanylate-binding family protein n=1 Tax=Medicago truncatula TaxID=3880 RepID=A0A072UMS0_MEDTR|nr:guanylate-binding family protein [Medicago truncatula]
MFNLFNRNKENPADASPQSPAPARPSSSSSQFTGPPRAIRLVYCDEKGKFRMDPEAVAILQLVKEPIGVVSVCGRARQGKSYILNQLLGSSGGFKVASTHRPCTKGLWMWSAPLKRTALDGTEYNLLLLDSEGIDAYDQTGTYSTQIFSLAVLLSSMFIYNQMGGIDEAALDRLSLVTQMAKHIRVRASGEKTSASEIGQFSPIFVWLLRDFYLDLTEDNRKITPRDYLELALRSVQGNRNDVAAKNEIRESIRALFPDRECFTLVRPLNNENDLQRLDQISSDKLRPEFRRDIQALIKFVFERTRPKQVGATMMTGPVLIGITESYLDALNHGAVPTISSSWQSVEEAECRRAYDFATEVYMASFDRSKPPEEVALMEAHEQAVQKSMSAFNASAVGVGAARKKYEGQLQKFLKKAFEDYKRNAFMEADIQCSNAIHSMEKRLRAACNASDARVDNVAKVLDALLSEYEKSIQGPGKWKKLAVFLQQSFEGPVLDLFKRVIDKVESEKSSLALQRRLNEDKMTLLTKRLEASEGEKSEYINRYEDAINDKKKLTDEYMNRITELQANRRSLDERYSSLLKTLDSSKQESMDWKRKYEHVLSRQKAEEGQTSSEIAALKSRSSAAEARLAAAREQAQSAQEEADEWKRKYDVAVREAKSALEKAAIVQERTNKQTQLREDVLREEFSGTLAEKDEEIKEKTAKIEHAEMCLTTLKLELKAAESKIRSYDTEISSLRNEIKDLTDRMKSENAKAQSYEREAIVYQQEKNHLEQKYQSEFKRFEEVQERCKTAEKEAARATEVADRARAEAGMAQKEKSEMQRLAMERLAQIERAERRIETLGREKDNLEGELQRATDSEKDARLTVAKLEEKVQQREKDLEALLDKDKTHRRNNAQILEQLLETEREAHTQANNRAETLSLQLQSAQAKIDSLHQELTKFRMNETLDSKLKTTSDGKRLRAENDTDSVQDMDASPRILRGAKRARSTTSPKYTQPEDGGSIYEGAEDNLSQQANEEDHTKFTIPKLKRELTKHNFGDQLLQLKNPMKKDLVALYEKCILQR